MRLFQSTIGLKILMALSGLVGVGFVVGHMLGNRQIFLGKEVLNDYAATVHGNAALLWGRVLFYWEPLRFTFNSTSFE